MTGDQPVILTKFRDHNFDEFPAEKIGPELFFQPEEYEAADHHFVGEFDEYGQFNGEVEIYGQRYNFICNWPEGKGRFVKCGPFSINVVYIMGNQKESRLSLEEHKRIMDKVYRIGGLYIYKDKIRVLPYGNTDNDFLEIEKRRTYSAQDWFFSFRRMFGYIAISSGDNSQLNEKAGREGFRQNQAYRDFRAILINLFKRLAIEFFRPTSVQSEFYWEKKNQLSADALLLEKQKKKADERRKDFRKLLEAFFEKYENNKFELNAEDIANRIKSKLNQTLAIDDNSEFAIKIRELEMDKEMRLQTLENEITITKPRGLALTKRLEKDWAAYQRLATELQENLITPLRKELDTSIRGATENRISHAQRREAALEILENKKSILIKDLSSLRRDAYGAQDKLQKTLRNVIREEFNQFRSNLENMLTDFTRRTAQDPASLDEARTELENKIASIREHESQLLEAIKRQMDELAEGLKDRETLDDRVGALEQQNERLEEQLDFYSDFAQMGMSVGILQHEFEKTAQDLRSAIRDLKPWADGTPALKTVYNKLRLSFDHLDGYLKLLDPLGRRVRRTKVEIAGEEIRLHLKRIFGKRLEDERIELKPTSDFIKKSTACYSSALLGAFINVIDNAIYWVSNGAQNERWIKLDADEQGYLISNSGPGIEERYRERIFEFGETQKPGGRGMGLSISKDTLQKEGFDLELIQAGKEVPPIFRIKTVTDESEVDDE